jgi:fructose-1,6-bisphosphatase/inositol monophosphatase family enzyme
MLKKLLDFVQKAGDYAKQNQSKVDFLTSRLKSVSAGDVVTETDMEISRRFRDFVDKEFSDLDYVIVDEERVGDLGDSPMEEIKRYEYVFVIDPIDGTLPYSVGLPYYGVSVGVFQHQKPFVSATYSPDLKMLLYSNEESAFIKENDAVPKKLKQLKDAAALYANSQHCLSENNELREQINAFPLTVYSAVVNGNHLAMGKSRCWTTRSSFWDLAGNYGLFKKTGVEIFDPKTDKPIDFFDEKLFDKNLRLLEPKIICLPLYYDDFKKFYGL